MDQTIEVEWNMILHSKALKNGLHVQLKFLHNVTFFFLPSRKLIEIV